MWTGGSWFIGPSVTHCCECGLEGVCLSGRVLHCCECGLEGVGLSGRVLHIVVNVYWRDKHSTVYLSIRLEERFITTRSLDANTQIQTTTDLCLILTPFIC